MSATVTKIIMVLGIFAYDMLIYYWLRHVFPILKTLSRARFERPYWLISALVILCFWFLDLIFLSIASYQNRRIVISFIALVLVCKLITGIYLTLYTIAKAGVQIYRKLFPPTPSGDRASGSGVTRKQFLYRSAVMALSLPVAVKGFSIINQAYDYQVRRLRIVLPNLPKAFHGLKIGQISDIHCGSFNNKVAVGGGIDLLHQEKPDLIFFTGDLVNRQTDEVTNYIDVFSKVKAPLGVFSVLGNHDYGEYRAWPSEQAKSQDFEDMLEAHRELGWTLLRNENHILTDHGASLAILGVENWGIKRFSKYGKISEAYRGTEEADTRLLLSHDPSHWEAKVLDYPDVDITFSGHTHGFQFGIEVGDFRWSPSQYLYKQWAGLYQKGNQYIYVNRGYGFVGMPGRIGIPPEITIVELIRA